jgi:RNA polymerase sigma factor (sigma-70 family)
LESFNQLVAQYEPMIYKIMQSLHLYKNLDEFYQLGLIGLWEASERFDSGRGEFTNYAYATIKGKLLTELAKSKQFEERTLHPEEEFWAVLEEPQAEEAFEEPLFVLYRKKLTKNQYKWLLYTVQGGLSVKEIAKRESVSPSAVKAWRAGAREKLKRMIIEEKIIGNT